MPAELVARPTPPWTTLVRRTGKAHGQKDWRHTFRSVPSVVACGRDGIRRRLGIEQWEGPGGKGKPVGPTDSTEIAVEPASQESSEDITTAGNPNQDCDGDSGGNSDTGNGANQGDAYDNTCDSPDDNPARGNGNGSGERVGIPCTGCVAQADDKNPQGQMPDASDRNNGYECDGNKGIAKGNPAHTTCSPPLTQDNPPQDNLPQDNPPTTEVLGSGGTKPPTQVLGIQLSKEPGATEVLGVAMARTGVEAVPLSLIALALMGIGIALMNAPRPLRTTV